MHEIDRVFTRYPFFGNRRIAACLPLSGFFAGRHCVRRLMAIMGLQANHKRPNTSKKHPRHRIYPNLPGKLSIMRRNQVWCSDITYIPVRNGFLYLVAIVDRATRKVLTRRLSKMLDASFCVEALAEAIARYGKPEIMNTEQGGQFTGAGWITTLIKASIKISIPLGVCLQAPSGNKRAGPPFGHHLHRTIVAFSQAEGRLSARNH
jgi:putative transposase